MPNAQKRSLKPVKLGGLAERPINEASICSCCEVIIASPKTLACGEYRIKHPTGLLMWHELMPLASGIGGNAWNGSPRWAPSAINITSKYEKLFIWGLLNTQSGAQRLLWTDTWWYLVRPSCAEVRSHSWLGLSGLCSVMMPCMFEKSVLIFGNQSWSLVMALFYYPLTLSW